MYFDSWELLTRKGRRLTAKLKLLFNIKTTPFQLSLRRLSVKPMRNYLNCMATLLGSSTEAR
ncbi:hypothetical protein A7D01_15415 [Xanthomonas arboricola]|nr:hypothetical protein A7D01_15415 [Xanthomonas arboricola]